MQIQAVTADCDTCQQCQLLGQYVPNIARQVQGLTGGHFITCTMIPMGGDGRESAVKAVLWAWGKNCIAYDGTRGTTCRDLSRCGHRLHCMFMPMVCNTGQVYLSVGTGCQGLQDNHRHGQVEIMLNATRFALRLVTESAYLCLDLGISLFVNCHAWGLPASYKGRGLPVSLVEVQRLMTA